MSVHWSKAAKRYHQRFWPTMFIYFATIVPVSWLFRHHPPEGPVKYVLAVLPGLPIIGVVAILGLYVVEETDEFVRAKIVQSMLWGIGLTLCVTTVWGFVENFAEAPHVPIYLTFPLFCLGMAAGQLVNRWRYR